MRWCSEEVRVDGFGLPQVNGWYEQMRLDAWSMCSRSTRQGAACGSRNRPETVVGAEAVEEKLGWTGGVLGEGNRGERERSHWRLSVCGQGALIARH